MELCIGRNVVEHQLGHGIVLHLHAIALSKDYLHNPLVAGHALRHSPCKRRLEGGSLGCGEQKGIRVGSGSRSNASKQC